MIFFTLVVCQLGGAQRVFWPQIYFTPLVLRLRGQVGHQTKWNSSRNWLFLVLSATFHQKLNNLQKCPKISKKCQFWVFFKSFLNFGWKVAHETISIQFLEDFCFFWCPTWSVSHETIGDISGFTLCFEIWQQQRPLCFLHDFQSNPWGIFTSFDGNISGFANDY